MMKEPRTATNRVGHCRNEVHDGAVFLCKDTQNYFPNAGFCKRLYRFGNMGEPLAPDFMFTAFLVLLRSLFFVDMKIRLSSRWIIVLSIIVLLVIDQVVKVVVKTNMTLGEAIPVFGQWFFIRFIENDGAAYGMKLAEGPWGKMALSLIRIGLVGFISYYIHTLVKKGAPKGVIAGMSLILVGALGNIIDSMFYGVLFTESTFDTVARFAPEEGYSSFLHGYVVDMLHFPIIETTYPDWVPIWGGEDFVFFSPVFNIADAYISVGFIYLILFQHKYFNRPKQA